MLAAVLGELPKENRLFRALMYDRQLAASVSASHPTEMLAGTVEVELYARPGEKLDELVKIADAEIERIKTEGPTALEVKKAQNTRESALIMGLQSVTRKAALLNRSMQTYGDPLGYRAELEKVFVVTPDDVRRVARQYLGASRIEIDVLPGARRRARPKRRSTDPHKRLWRVPSSRKSRTPSIVPSCPNLVRRRTTSRRPSSGARSPTVCSS